MPNRRLGCLRIDILEGRALSGDPLDYIRQSPAAY